MSLSTHYHAHKPNVPIIMEDVFGWVREGNAFQVRVWLDDTEHDLNVGYVYFEDESWLHYYCYC